MNILQSGIGALATLATIGIANASPLSDCGLDKSDCRNLIGKRLWIVVPKGNPGAVEFGPSPTDWSVTTKLKNGSSFLIEGVAPQQYSGHSFRVSLPDGRKGYVSAFNYYWFLETDPVENAKKDAAEAQSRREECERRGQPKIGMTAEQIFETCWGRPRRIVKKTTATGVEENMIYTIGHIIRMNDGKAAEIIETRQ